MYVVCDWFSYTPDVHYGIIASAEGNGVILSQENVAMPALEDILIWSTKTGIVVNKLSGSKHVVTCLRKFPDRNQLAAGYYNGDIQIWDYTSGESLILFSSDGAYLVSGSQDTDIIVWDIINESGLYRLRGHKGPIHDAQMMTQHNLLVSCSRDGLVKFWDLDTQHCVHSLLGHRSEVNGFVMLNDETTLITGSSDDELRCWSISYEQEFTKPGESSLPGQNKSAPAMNNLNVDISEDQPSKRVKESLGHPISSTLIGSVSKKGTGRVMTLTLTPDQRCLICQSASKIIDIFRIRSVEEQQKRRARKLKRAKEKGKDPGIIELSVSDLYPLAGTLACPSAVRAIDVSLNGPNLYNLLATLNSNSFEIYTLTRTAKAVDSERSTYLALPGHRKPIRSLALSSDAALVLTTSNSSAKLWNRQTGQCIRTFSEAGYGVSAMFVPGDRQALIGTKEGLLKLYDLASGECLQTEEDIHTKAIWSISLLPDKQGFITGSADQTVKFWQFELIQSEDMLRKTLSVEHTKTLEMTDEVTSTTFSPDGRLLAIALLDSTVKVVYSDTLKPFLSLYGHKLPVVTMAISSDNTLLATGSADKNVKIWGLDFGDCHKSFRAHQDTVTSVCFAGTTHYVFSTSRDKTIKQWDADSFVLIQTLEGHQGPISCCAISSRGDVLVTGSHDKSIRTWVRTREMLNVEEEQSISRELNYEIEQTEQEAREFRAKTKEDEVAVAGKRSSETLKAADRLIEAIHLAVEEDAKGGSQFHKSWLMLQIIDSGVHPMFLANNCKNGLQYVQTVLEKTPSSELEEALMLMPFSLVQKFLNYLLSLLTANLSTERCSRCIVFLLRSDSHCNLARVHHNQLITTTEYLDLISRLQDALPRALGKLKNMVGFNLAALRFLRQQFQEELNNIGAGAGAIVVVAAASAGAGAIVVVATSAGAGAIVVVATSAGAVIVVMIASEAAVKDGSCSRFKHLQLQLLKFPDVVESSSPFSFCINRHWHFCLVEVFV
eukprot:gene727-4020_t